MVSRTRGDKCIRSQKDRQALQGCSSVKDSWSFREVQALRISAAAEEAVGKRELTECAELLLAIQELSDRSLLCKAGSEWTTEKQVEYTSLLKSKSITGVKGEPSGGERSWEGMVYHQVSP